MNFLGIASIGHHAAPSDHDHALPKTHLDVR